MSTPAANGGPSAQKPMARAYRRFIVPSMHRRFTNTAILSLALSSLEAIWMGGFGSIWGFLGTVTMRSLLLFIPILAIFVVRVANMHVGKRTGPSQWIDLLSSLVSFTALRTMLWYLFSAWFFCEVYMWSTPTSARLMIVDVGKPYERPRLNERPIFLRSLFLCLGFVQCIIHIAQDYDKIPLPASKATDDLDVIVKRNQQPFTAPLAFLKQKLPSVVHRAFFRTFTMAFLGPIAYWLFVRRRAWSWSHWVARQMFSLPRVTRQPTLPPLIFDLLGRFLIEGFLLSLAWEFAHASFDVFLAQEPMKQGRLLTEESTDPNGSLLHGLKSNRPVARSFAFWELRLIAQYMQQRRQLIYQDIGRAGGSTWSQLHTVCLGEMHAVVQRIQAGQRAGVPAPSQAQSTQSGLPKLGNNVRQDNIFAPPKPVRFGQYRGQDSQAYNIVDKSATKAIEYASTYGPKHEPITKDSVTGLIKSALVAFLRTPVGAIFRQTFARRASAVVLGEPYSQLSTILDAIVIIKEFVVHSKKEDRFGTVYRDIPTVIRTLTSSHRAIEGFVQGLDVHWTDVEFEPEDRNVVDVQLILNSLQDSVQDIVNEFGEYADDLGLSGMEMRAAKEVVGKGATDEMRQVGGR